MPNEKPQFLDPSNFRKKTEQRDVVTCSKCGCRWMEIISVQQYPKDHSVILGQKPGTVSDVGFWMFRCPKCLETYEPRLVSGGMQDSAHKNYDEFVKKMTEKKEGEGESV